MGRERHVGERLSRRNWIVKSRLQKSLNERRTRLFRHVLATNLSLIEACNAT